MNEPVRFLHTADWQLGLRLNFVDGDAGARLRAERFEVVRRIAQLARERAVDAVLVAGDVFDDNAVGADTVQLAVDALGAFADIPVILLPGNHDPATPDSVFGRLRGLADTVRLAVTAEPVQVGGLEILPCPLMRRHERDDPCAWIPARDGDARVRVALAHGAALSFSELSDSPNRIDVASLIARGVDYVALGDWHGVFEVSERAWYAGAPEATRFKEANPGHVLIVECAGPGAMPVIERVRVARSRWMSKEVEFAVDEDLAALAQWFDGLEDKSWTLLRLVLTGSLSLPARARLDELLDDVAQRLAHLRLKSNSVAATPDDAALAALEARGYLADAVSRLRNEPHPANDDAMLLLYRLLNEARD